MAKRTRRGVGSVSQRQDGRWHGRFTRPDGKRAHVYGRTQEEASRKLDQARRAAEEGIDPNDERTTVGTFLKTWLESIRPPDVPQDGDLKPRTWESYGGHVRNHLDPALGSLKLAKLRASHINKLLADLRRSGLSPATVDRVRATLRVALNEAVRDGRIRENPVKNARRSKRTGRAFRGTALTPAQANSLLDATEGDRLHALWTIALGTGLRLGECLGLRWQDVDLEAGVVAVNHTLQPKRPGFDSWALIPPKSQESRRAVNLADWVAEDLRAHRAAQRRERLRAGDEWVERGFVFSNRTGGPLDGAEVGRSLKKALDVAGLPRCRFHDLRHTAASLLLAQGASLKTVQVILGHSTIAITADLYAHVYDAARKEAAAMAEVWRTAR